MLYIRQTGRQMIKITLFLECENQHLRLVDGVISHVNTTVNLLNTTRRDNMFCQYRITVPSEMKVFEESCSSSWRGVVEGRVEICMNNEYQSVCDDRWDVQEARIVCQQLLHSSRGKTEIRLTYLYVYNLHIKCSLFHKLYVLEYLKNYHPAEIKLLLCWLLFIVLKGLFIANKFIILQH